MGILASKEISCGWLSQTNIYWNVALLWSQEWLQVTPTNWFVLGQLNRFVFDLSTCQPIVFNFVHLHRNLFIIRAHSSLWGTPVQWTLVQTMFLYSSVYQFLTILFTRSSDLLSGPASSSRAGQRFFGQKQILPCWTNNLILVKFTTVVSDPHTYSKKSFCRLWRIIWRPSKSAPCCCSVERFLS